MSHEIGLYDSPLRLYYEPSAAERLQGLVLRPGRCTHQGEEVLGQAARAHPVVRGVGAPNRTGQRTEFNVAPGADQHPVPFQPENDDALGSHCKQKLHKVSQPHLPTAESCRPGEPGPPRGSA